MHDGRRAARPAVPPRARAPRRVRRAAGGGPPSASACRRRFRGGLCPRLGEVGAVAVVAISRVADARADHVRLAARGDLLADPLPRPLQVVRPLHGGHHVRGDRRAAGRQLGQRGDLQVTEHGHRHRARDRRRGHHQHVRPGSRGLLAERVALLDAEPVLLVDDHQAEVGELHLLLEQRVRADEDAGVAGEHVAQRAAAGPHAGRAGEQGHPGRLLARGRAAFLPARRRWRAARAAR